MKSRNFVAALTTVSAPPGADTEFTVPHGMQEIPADGFVVQRSSNANLYRGTTAWTSTNAYLKSSAGSVQYLVFFFV